MFGKGVFQEEEILLRNIIRSIDKRVDYSAKEGEGSRFTVHIKLRAHRMTSCWIWKTSRRRKPIR